MKCNTTLLAIVATIIPVICSQRPAHSGKPFRIPTCGAESCLAATNGTFNACSPHDLACLCSLTQANITQYVSLVQPCIDGEIGNNTCTDGAIFQYKDLLTTVCADDRFGNKDVEFPPRPTP